MQLVMVKRFGIFPRESYRWEGWVSLTFLRGEYTRLKKVKKQFDNFRECVIVGV